MRIFQYLGGGALGDIFFEYEGGGNFKISGLSWIDERYILDSDEKHDKIYDYYDYEDFVMFTHSLCSDQQAVDRAVNIANYGWNGGLDREDPVVVVVDKTKCQWVASDERGLFIKPDGLRKLDNIRIFSAK